MRNLFLAVALLPGLVFAAHPMGGASYGQTPIEVRGATGATPDLCVAVEAGDIEDAKCLLGRLAKFVHDGVEVSDALHLYYFSKGVLVAVVTAVNTPNGLEYIVYLEYLRKTFPGAVFAKNDFGVDGYLQGVVWFATSPQHRFIVERQGEAKAVMVLSFFAPWAAGNN